jgi:hypothetical protein
LCFLLKNQGKEMRTMHYPGLSASPSIMCHLFSLRLDATAGGFMELVGQWYGWIWQCPGEVTIASRQTRKISSTYLSSIMLNLVLNIHHLCGVWTGTCCNLMMKISLLSVEKFISPQGKGLLCLYRCKAYMITTLRFSNVLLESYISCVSPVPFWYA